MAAPRRVRRCHRLTTATTIYYCATSLDGYIAEADDSLDWLLNYEGTSASDAAEPSPMSEGGGYERFYEGVGALVAGSVTYQWILDHIDVAGAGGECRTGESRSGF